jgi:DNA polymerase-3 subunit delta'
MIPSWLNPQISSLRAAHAAGRLPHALLIHDSPGAGGDWLANWVATLALCLTPAEAPCGHCVSCRRIANDQHPDLARVVPIEESKQLRIEQVRELAAELALTSHQGGYKVGILAPADSLNRFAANALLKTLEEPPGALRIVMAGGDPERLLPTIRSRVQCLALQLPEAATALAWLKAQGVAGGERALAVAGGSPLAAQTLIDAGVSEDDLQTLPRAVASGDAQALLGKPLPLVIDLLLRLAHDAMAQGAGAAPRFFDAGQMPPAAPLQALQSWQQELLRAARHDEHPWNASLLVEALVTNGARCWASARKPAHRRTGHSIHSAG